ASQLVRRNVIVPPHHEIAKIFSRDKLLRPETGVGEGNALAIGHPKAPRKFAIYDFRFTIGSARPGIDGFIVVIRGMGGPDSGLDILPGTSAGIDQTGRLQYV